MARRLPCRALNRHASTSLLTLRRRLMPWQHLWQQPRGRPAGELSGERSGGESSAPGSSRGGGSQGDLLRMAGGGGGQ